MRTNRTAVLMRMLAGVWLAAALRVHAQTPTPSASPNAQSTAPTQATVATAQPDKPGARPASQTPPRRNPAPKPAAQAPASTAPAQPPHKPQPRGDAPIDPWAEHRPMPKPEPAQPAPAKPAQPAPAPAAPVPAQPNETQPAPAKPPQTAPAAPAHPEDAAIVHQLELFMLLEMMKDYDLFYDDPEPAPAK